MDLKIEKEAFVSGLEGTTVSEIYLLSATLLVGYFLRCCFLVCVCQTTPNLLTRFLLEFTSVILPAILIFTVLADYAVYILISELLTGTFLVLNRLRPVVTSGDVLQKVETLTFPSRYPFVTITRAFVNLFTAVAILAVDFSIFPRRLAKAETFGSGLMDIGVGAFLMCHGLTAPEARSDAGKKKEGESPGFLRVVWVTLRQVLPLFLLGVLRLASVKTTGYQEHITEYGLHWNFFFTIATVRMMCSLLHPLLNCFPCGYGLFALVLATSYQALLQWAGLDLYILLGPNGDGSRIGLVSANREGLVSCLGYLALYTGWIEVGKRLLKPRRLWKDFLPILLALLLSFISLWLLTNWLEQHLQPISRRFVNLTYILWMFSYGALVLCISLAIDLLTLFLVKLSRCPPPPPYDDNTTTTTTTTTRHSAQFCAVSAVDYNQLAFFLLANVLTGLVNVSVDTLHTGTVSALVILTLYMATLTTAFFILHRFQLKIKF